MGVPRPTTRDYVARTVELVPDKSITDAIGRGHTLATAVADVIDNSLDAKAEHIRIRFVTDADRLIAVRIRDDGIGMTPELLQDAMTLGKQNSRDGATLGHFGIGLKAASLSQALTLTVYSRSYNAGTCAMRIRRGSFAGEVLDESAAEEGREWDARGPASTGTVVEWRDLETVNQSQLPSERRAWLERTITSLLQTLGLTFHRLIQDRGIRIQIDTWDIRVGSPGLPRTVEPRDPFQFSIPGHPGYPTILAATTSDGARLDAECFVLPPKSDSASAWLLGRNPAEWQGIYVYRNDRLLQAGGWLDVRQDDKRFRLARVRINLTKELERHLRLKHEKNGVTSTPEFTAALEAAKNDAGVTLDRFREDAAETYRASNVRKQTVKPAVPIKSGLPDRVVEAVRSELGERDDDPIQIEWKMLPSGRLFELQHERRAIRFNLGYYTALGGADAAIVPTLTYLLLEGNFTKSRLNQVTKDQIDAWQSIAAAALLTQLREDAYDTFADLPKPDTDPLPRPDIMDGPRPAPPSIELRWAHLGHRGQVPPETGLEDPTATESDALDAPTPFAPIERLGGAAAGPTASESPASVLPRHREAISELHKTPDVPRQSDGRKPTADVPNSLRSSPPPVNARPGDREIVAMYRSGGDIETIAATLEIEARDVAIRLCSLIIDLEGDDIDDHQLAAMDGIPYTPEERERILEMFRDRRPVRMIAAHFHRTPFAIAWQLLSSPKRPVEVPKNLLKRVDRALAARVTAQATDANDQSLAG